MCWCWDSIDRHPYGMTLPENAGRHAGCASIILCKSVRRRSCTWLTFACCLLSPNITAILMTSWGPRSSNASLAPELMIMPLPLVALLNAEHTPLHALSHYRCSSAQWLRQRVPCSKITDGQAIRENTDYEFNFTDVFFIIHFKKKRFHTSCLTRCTAP